VTDSAFVHSHVGFLTRLGRFLKKPWLMQVRTVGLYSRHLYPSTPIPIRLPIGIWWVAWDNHLGYHLLTDGFEEPEYAFVESFLKKSMTVLDIGANEGYYTLLASRCVGQSGQVIAFEPSPRERRRLRTNLLINNFRNVQVLALAVGSSADQVNLHVVKGPESGCNSLRPPDIQGETKPLKVNVTTLDDFLRRNGTRRVDFIKMDVEGAELSVLRGASGLLRTTPRPFIMTEISDLRTRPWGYQAKEIASFLFNLDFALFRPSSKGRLDPIDVDEIETGCDFNIIAVPRERILEATPFLEATGAGLDLMKCLSSGNA
jgi:FkbM family methyltransferase